MSDLIVSVELNLFRCPNWTVTTCWQTESRAETNQGGWIIFSHVSSRSAECLFVQHLSRKDYNHTADTNAHWTETVMNRDDSFWFFPIFMVTIIRPKIKIWCQQLVLQLWRWKAFIPLIISLWGILIWPQTNGRTDDHQDLTNIILTT